jgi:hypothetical protein
VFSSHGYYYGKYAGATDSPGDDLLTELRGYNSEIADGTYDFATDPATVGAVYISALSPTMASVDALRAATNNNNITEEVFSAIYRDMTGAGLSNGVIYYYHNADGGAYGKYILVGIAGFSFSNSAYQGSRIYNLDPSDESFSRFGIGRPVDLSDSEYR